MPELAVPGHLAEDELVEILTGLQMASQTVRGIAGWFERAGEREAAQAVTARWDAMLGLAQSVLDV
jgi:hypothetical protein